ncbi:MAG TPA: ATP-binding cassette domain-containing protein [Salinivirgaceae bacterium]|nr:ATP-binding cassette domain-containing protein [Salinivirgaceae bacterium]
MIEVKDINKSFNEVAVLKKITADFQPGIVNLIIGRSGSGKTVLLKTIVGLHTPDSGDVLFNGRNFFQLNNTNRRYIRREIGMLFQGGALFDWATVEENVRFPLDFFTDWTKKEKEIRVSFCLERVNLLHAAKLMPSELSGGMQKRVAIARAISLNPKYLFCDEPNSGLDPQTSAVIDHLIFEITHEYKITTVVNTHDLNSVLRIGEKIIFIHQGQKWWEGDRNTILTSQNEELRDYLIASEVLIKSGIVK